MENHFWTVKNICFIALFAVFLFVQEQALAFLPNIQLTFFFIILFSKILGFKKTVFIVVIYFLLDCFITGSLIPVYIAFQLLGWLCIPLLLSTVFKKVQSNLALAFLAALFSLLYSWIMIFPSCLVFQTTFLAYIIADLPFEALLVGSSFLSTLLLYNPLYKALNRLIKEA